MSDRPTTTPLQRERGFALIFVMVMLLLCGLVVLGSARLGWLQERMLGAESDHQRAFAAAEALIRDAELDIRGQQANADQPCRPEPAFVGCRNFGAGHPFFPQDENDLDLLQARLASTATGCLRGICLPSTVRALGLDNWTTQLPAMTAGTGDTSVAARYGEFTGIHPASAGNALLHWSRPGDASAVAPRAWYWVEVFWYDSGIPAGAASLHELTPDQKHPFVYRITAYVQGLKPGTRVWLRSVYVPRPQAGRGLQ
ncbi:pilus assembly PilX family protein [Hydrogenophaga laconesensis]|uniref:Type IV pilus assembly protein PilX n=1 Tax=Hydrogenophaga laconesensis TaxID=1805971 RepID=A0ABU1V5K9_9BURK|nr:PilX N-terminal domain-containing pilus assembly protein [Hydrogenophaga laconesensis]MDR7092732.1 type IV pilus assembly protein PilX [Hydrogenophaga laconesensis]